MLQVCLFGCCICFTHMLQVFYLDVAYVFAMVFQVFSGIFTSVADTCFKGFICLHTYVANISSECFKSRSGVAHVAMMPVTGRQRPAAGLRLLPCAACLALSYPILSLPSLPFPSLSCHSNLSSATRHDRGRAARRPKGRVVRRGRS
jgi:hypothetical protein